MNTITVKNLPAPYNYNENYLVIDGIPITEWFTKYRQNSEGLSKFDLNGLYPAWSNKLEYDGDNRAYGISYLETYTDEDWEKYGDNIATEEFGSREWREWIAENWQEELYRRRLNHTRNFYKQPGSVIWIYEPNWKFDRKEYENCVAFYHRQGANYE